MIIQGTHEFFFLKKNLKLSIFWKILSSNTIW